MLTISDTFNASFAVSQNSEDKPQRFTASSSLFLRPRTRSSLQNESVDPLRTLDPVALRESAASLTPNHFLKPVLQFRMKIPEERHKQSLVRPSSSTYNSLYCGYKHGKPLPFHDPSKLFRVFQQRKPVRCSTLQLPRPKSSCHLATPSVTQSLEAKLRFLGQRYMQKYGLNVEAMRQLRQIYECVRRREPKFGSCRANSVLSLDGQMQAVVEFLLKHEKKLGVRAALQGHSLLKFERLLLHLQRDVFL